MDYRRSVAESIPAAAVLLRARRRRLVEPRVTVVGVRLDDAVLHPAGERRHVYLQASREVVLREQPASAKASEARAEAVCAHDVLHSFRGESCATLAGPRSAARMKPPRVEDVGDLVVD